jgi:SPP1 family predicted phage head-tail adaptor
MAIRKSSQYYQIGKLNKRATIQTYTATADGMGGNTLVWNNSGTIYCDIMPINGQETLRFGAVDTDITHVIKARYRANLTPQNRLTYSGRTFNIRSVVSKGEDNQFIEILTAEVT